MASNLFGILLFGVIVNCSAVVLADDLVVMTENGKVQGHYVTYDSYEYITFLGIPYAAPMTGNNRFKAPLPAKPWSGILIANRTIECQEYEDCLVVNVFTPKNKNKIFLPVIVDVHPGAFFMGTGGRRGDEQLVRKEIIVVRFNFRLGALGFLCLRTNDVPGNAGMKDQVAALKWIQRNIARFGGDPNRVTLFGSSSGGASAHLILLSKMARGLFQKAIIDSGSALSTWTIDYDPIATAKEFAIALNFPKIIDDIDQLTDFYRKVDVNDLYNQSQKSYRYKLPRNIPSTLGFVPCVESPQTGTEAFLSEHPVDILKKNQYQKVPMLISFASHEAMNFINEFFKTIIKPKLESGFDSFLPTDLVLDTKERKQVAKIVEKVYLRDNIDKDLGYFNFFGDTLTAYGILESARLHSEYTTVYLLKFVLATNLGFTFKGESAHANFAYHIFPKKYIPTTQHERLAVNRATTLIENFVKFGNPTPDDTNQLIPLIWPALEPGQPMTYLYFDWNMTLLKDPYPERMALWRHIYKQFPRRKPTKNILSKSRTKNNEIIFRYHLPDFRGCIGGVGRGDIPLMPLLLDGGV